MKDLENWNMSCDLDACENRYGRDSLATYSCNCEPTCIQSDTCCLGSQYVNVDKKGVKHTCRSVYSGGAYLMVDRCPSSDSIWENLCKQEWSGEDDVLKIVPVTSLQTFVTYKNYFCFRCHELTDEFLYWNVQLENDKAQYNEKKFTSLKYDSRKKTWMLAFGNERTAQKPVNLTVLVPFEIYLLTKNCILDVISTCSDEWSDTEMIEKCHGYTAIKQVEGEYEKVYTYYKNTHCALCNYEDLSDVQCKSRDISGFGAKIPFSFTYLLDINRSDGDKVGQIKKCNDDHMWDPYAQKCRKLTCAIPGYEIKNGKCAAA